MANITILIPDPLNSDEQFYRFYHRDITAMETEALLDELNAIKSQL